MFRAAVGIVAYAHVLFRMHGTAVSEAVRPVIALHLQSVSFRVMEYETISRSSLFKKRCAAALPSEASLVVKRRRNAGMLSRSLRLQTHPVWAAGSRASGFPFSVFALFALHVLAAAYERFLLCGRRLFHRTRHVDVDR